MTTAKLIVGIGTAVLSWMIPDAVAQAPGRPGSYAIIVESPFTGVVVSATPTSLTANGEVTLTPRRAYKANGNATESKTERQDVDFSVKSATFTRDDKPCTLKDIRKGDSAMIEFTAPKQGSTKFIAMKVVITSKGHGASK